MTTQKHMWRETEQMDAGDVVQRCAHCETERVKDKSTKTLYLYRRGRALGPGRRKLGEGWNAFKAGVVPKCPGPVL